MSFQDFGKSSSRRTTAASASLNGGGGGHQAYNRNQMAGGSIPEGSAWGQPSSNVGQISESLSQYQRNVGILEKISQQLLATPANASNRSELEQQYKVQLDVLRQLEQRLRQQILSQRKQVGTSESKKQALIKLERDFQRVQGIAQSYKARVTRQQKQYQQRGTDPTGMGGMSADNRAANTLQQEQERFQIQLQEDKMAEEIMREREEEIRNINKGMHTVNQIYKDLAHIVGSQQEQIDTIETQMEDARNNAESGLTQVQKANEKYNQSNCTIM